MKPIKVLIADDHEMVRLGLVDAIGSHPDFVVSAAISQGDEVLASYREHKPDILLLDYRMPGMNGDEITDNLIEYDPGAKVVILTSCEWEEDIWRAFSAGAKGYLPKSVSIKKICEVLIQVAEGKDYFPPDILKKIDTRKRREKLTEREIDILLLLAEGLSNKEICSKLDLAASTVKTHISSILAKLSVLDRTQAVVKAVRLGMVQLGS